MGHILTQFDRCKIIANLRNLPATFLPKNQIAFVDVRVKQFNYLEIVYGLISSPCSLAFIQYLQRPSQKNPTASRYGANKTRFLQGFRIELA